ncbi:MAG: hypothetical protein M1826_002608 [Phylliscum demangeonii]|nr:MAG: hypothetical protein M1826_002608 [Phylliscum demangeonii]
MEKGEISLPSNAEIAQWDKEQDDESWLDIDFEDLEQELSGSSKTEENGKRAAFGDKTAQENLRKMVERFEAFLNDDTTGPEGASGWDEVDEDDDETDDEDEDDEGEDRDASFDEEQFAQMMREMMGLPSEDADEPGGRESGTKGKNTSRVKELPSDLDDEEDDEDIRDVMKQVETELKEAGALDLDSSSKEPRAAKKADHAGKRKEEAGQSNGEGHSDLDYNLARNLLESFKGQAGTMIGSLGLRFPRDEEEDHNE